MNYTHELDFAYIRTEKDDKYTLFLKVDVSILDKSLDVELNSDRQFVIKQNNVISHKTKKLPSDIFDSLANRHTLAVFTDSDGNFLAKQLLEPLLINIQNKKIKP